MVSVLPWRAFSSGLIRSYDEKLPRARGLAGKRVVDDGRRFIRIYRTELFSCFFCAFFFAFLIADACYNIDRKRCSS